MDDKVAIITGAGQGIGEAISLKLAKKNFHTLLVSRSFSNIKMVKKRINALGKKSSIYDIDVSNHKDVKNFISEIIEKFKRIDILVNNAGIARSGTSNIKLHHLKQMIDVNLVGTIYITNMVAAHMKKQKDGYIINISSLSGKIAEPAIGGYSASKFGLSGYSDSLHQELINHNIRVTAIYPRAVNTSMIKGFIEKEKIDPKLLLQPEDIAEAINYLISQNKNIAIKEIIMNSGYMLKRNLSTYTQEY